MQSNILNCCICLVDYDRGEHIPKIVPSCGHTVCLSCLDGIFRVNRSLECPLDRVKFLDIYQTATSLPTNISLLQLLDEKPQPKFEVCKHHDDPINLVCITDGEKICRYCVDFGNHKGHQVKHSNDIQTEKEKKIQDLKLILEKFSDCENQAVQKLENCKKQAVDNVNLKFQQIQEFLIIKQKEIVSETESFFDRQKKKVESRVKNDSTKTQEEIAHHLSVLEKASLDQEFFKSFEASKQFQDALPNFTEKENYEPFFHKTLQGLDTALMHFQSLTNSIIQGFKPNLVEIQFSQNETNKKYLSLLEMTKRVSFQIQNNSIVISPIQKTSSQIPSSSKEIENFESIQQLIVTSNQAVFTNEMIKEIEIILPNFPKINHVQVKLNSQALTDQDLINLSKSNLWGQHQISSFEFDVFGCKVGNDGIIAIMSNAIIKLEHLKFLKLRLSETKITDKSIHMLANYVLYRTNNLRGLDLRLLGTQITDESVVPLCAAMKANLASASSLVLSLSETKVTEKSVDAFIVNTIPALKNLNTLEFYIGRTPTSENKISSIFLGLQNISHLKKVILGLEHTKTTHQNIQILATILPNLLNIADLALYLDGTPASKQDSLSLLQKANSKINFDISF